MWKNEAWDAVRLCFPSENKGSVILLTTRNNEVASYADTENRYLQMGFMDKDESWNLFKSASFANEALPSEYENIWKQIVDECQGIPLTIIVVVGLLKSKREIQNWTSVVKDVKSFVKNDPDERCSCVLGLSYNHLTNDLKRCLLYFGIFSEETEIPVKHLMRIWMAEGFLNSEKDLEGEAEKCLQDLINRCLVLVYKKSRDETKIRSLTSAKAFPATLKKLKLYDTWLSWSYLDVIAELPNLEFFLIEFNNLTNDNFPVLERLMLRICHHLEEIPIEFTEINTLQRIELTRCLPELGESAARIQQEQEDIGNNPVDVLISNPCSIKAGSVPVNKDHLAPA
ncbi:hypothetical protein BC332_24414 [Capsicum chinense]|nr:hypothetical protein BC332_24414 [Capsicum chinense]